MMAIVRPSLALLLSLACPLAAEAKKHARADAALLSPGKFVIESGLSSDAVVGCLANRNAKAPVLTIAGTRRVFLGPAEGWIDVTAQRTGSRLETRTEWVGGPAMERWARGCAAGKAPTVRRGLAHLL